ncbi:hypothetical protein P9057_08345 [Gallibacterium anatis]|uniref:hypothetical protein n=1 Tax=Gallibacterium anatis TaxID=750 RepID=UPI003005A035
MAKTLSEIATSHLNSEYRAEIITREDGLIRGVIKRDDIIIDQTLYFYTSERKAIIALNRLIKAFNLAHQDYLALLPVPEIKTGTIAIAREKPTSAPVKNISQEQYQQEQPMPAQTEVSDQTQTVTIKTQRKKVIPHKPFTPYGLNGYLVDKNGKVRLMLDRKANAKTITLEPEMFAMLADMVKATQQQGAIQC